MGKIGDLIVRLKLQYQDYEKGLKKANKSTQGFGATFGKIKGIALGVWGAIGAAAIKVGKDIIASSNEMQDAWEMFTTKAKAGWNTFVRTLVSGDWKNFVSNFKKEVAAAGQLTDAIQGNSEVNNSIRIQRAQYAQEIAKLEIAFRDTSKSDEERITAGKKLLDIEKKIYTQGIAGAQKLKDAYYEAFLGPVWGRGTGSNRTLQGIWDKMIIAYGELIEYSELGGMTFKEAMDYARHPIELMPVKPGETKGRLENQRRINEQLDFQKTLGAWAIKKFGLRGKTNEKAYEWLDVFFTNYETRLKGEEIDALVNAIVGLLDARAAYDEGTKKIQTGLGALTKSQKQVEQERTAWLKQEKLPELSGVLMAASAVHLEVPDIIPDDWLERNRANIDAAILEAKRLEEIAKEIDESFEKATVSSLSGATQALTDCIAGIEGADASQVLAALLEPFASTMISLGEMLLAEGLAIEVFKSSLKDLDGTKAIAAGTALIVLGAALSSGIRALSSSASGATSTSSYDSSSSTDNVQKYEQEITIHVVGEISGDKIVLAGQKTLNKWGR